MKILRSEMTLKGLTIKELSLKLGVTVGTISNWIHGDNKPTPKYAKQLKDMGFSDTACLDPAKEVEVYVVDAKKIT